MKEQISEEKRRISKKLKLNKESQFKSPGNKKQLTFNENLIHNLEEALRAVKTAKYDQAKDVIKESLADLKKQNKLVRIADRSIAGWDAANEYGSDNVAYDSEDEKRIRRAEQRALSKKKLDSLVAVLSLVVATVLVIVASHFLAMKTCANFLKPDTASPVDWRDTGERFVGTLHNEQDNDLEPSNSRFNVFPCLKASTKTDLPKKQLIIENWNENKTIPPLVKYNLDSLFSTQEC